MNRPDKTLQQFAISALEHAVGLLQRGGGELAPFAMSWRRGQRLIAIFEKADGALESARDHVRSLDDETERYAIGYVAFDSEQHSIVVIECGDRSNGFRFTLRYEEHAGRIWPTTHTSVGALPASLLSRAGH